MDIDHSTTYVLTEKKLAIRTRNRAIEMNDATSTTININTFEVKLFNWAGNNKPTLDATTLEYVIASEKSSFTGSIKLLLIFL